GPSFVYSFEPDNGFVQDFARPFLVSRPTIGQCQPTICHSELRPCAQEPFSISDRFFVPPQLLKAVHGMPEAALPLFSEQERAPPCTHPAFPRASAHTPAP